MFAPKNWGRYSTKFPVKITERIQAFVQLKEKIDQLSKEELQEHAQRAHHFNGWFTEETVKDALQGISYMLDADKLKHWTSRYTFSSDRPKIVGIVMAGNIPLVGFHDLVCVLISGNYAAIKPSSDDTYLTKILINWLLEIEPRFKKNVEIREKLTGVEAVIATGSDNTARYFEYYFRDVPHIIRKNRTSVAILSGSETDEELSQLGYDIFSYFGLGCRNVSKVFTPEQYDIREVFPLWEPYHDIVNHNKYRNNYDYYKSIYLVNKTPHLDTGFSLALSTDDLVSPISVLYHQTYLDDTHLNSVLSSYQSKIQCIVGKDHLHFGKAQRPELWDYADNINVLDFLTGKKQTNLDERKSM